MVALKTYLNVLGSVAYIVALFVLVGYLGLLGLLIWVGITILIAGIVLARNWWMVEFFRGFWSKEFDGSTDDEDDEDMDAAKTVEVKVL